MDDERQITFMQTRICRMAATRWKWPLRRVVALFAEFGVLDYLEDCFDYFHLEGDEAVLADVEEYLRVRKAEVHA